MDKESLRKWQDAVMLNCQALETVLNDRVTLKDLMEEHLKEFFEGYVLIEFDKDFNKITLKWEYQHDPIIKVDRIKDLGMDFIISHSYDSKYGEGVVLELYPFGLPPEGEIIER